MLISCLLFVYYLLAFEAHYSRKCYILTFACGFQCFFPHKLCFSKSIAAETPETLTQKFFFISAISDGATWVRSTKPLSQRDKRTFNLKKNFLNETLLTFFLANSSNKSGWSPHKFYNKAAKKSDSKFSSFVFFSFAFSESITLKRFSSIIEPACLLVFKFCANCVCLFKVHPYIIYFQLCRRANIKSLPPWHISRHPYLLSAASPWWRRWLSFKFIIYTCDNEIKMWRPKNTAHIHTYIYTVRTMKKGGPTTTALLLMLPRDTDSH